MSAKPKSGTAVMWVVIRTFAAAVTILLLAPLASGWLAWVAWFVFGWLVLDLIFSVIFITRQVNKSVEASRVQKWAIRRDEADQ